jgi:hypothetical protein
LAHLFRVRRVIFTASNRQFNEVGLIAAATWLVAAFLIVWLSWSGKPDKVILWIPVAW